MKIDRSWFLIFDRDDECIIARDFVEFAREWTSMGLFLHSYGLRSFSYVEKVQLYEACFVEDFKNESTKTAETCIYHVYHHYLQDFKELYKFHHEESFQYYRRAKSITKWLKQFS